MVAGRKWFNYLNTLCACCFSPSTTPATRLPLTNGSVAISFADAERLNRNKAAASRLARLND